MIIDVFIEGVNGRTYAYDAADFEVRVGDYVRIPPTPLGDPRYAKVKRLDSAYDGPVKPILGVVGKAPVENEVEDDSEPWMPGCPCGSCGSNDTDWDGVLGAHCLSCGATDADE